MPEVVETIVLTEAAMRKQPTAVIATTLGGARKANQTMPRMMSTMCIGIIV